MSAAVDGGALVFQSFPGDPAATRSWAARAGRRRCSRASSRSPTRPRAIASGCINPALYDRLAGRHGGSGIVDVTLGDNTFTQLDADGNPEFTVPGFAAVAGYDMASGLGTVDAAPFVAQLAKRARP